MLCFICIFVFSKLIMRPSLLLIMQFNGKQTLKNDNNSSVNHVIYGLIGVIALDALWFPFINITFYMQKAWMGITILTS